MKHPDYSRRINEILEQARHYYDGREVEFTGPDGHTRRCHVDCTTYCTSHGVSVSLWVPQIPDPSQRLWEPPWAREYKPVEDKALNWDI